MFFSPHRNFFYQLFLSFVFGFCFVSFANAATTRDPYSLILASSYNAQQGTTITSGNVGNFDNGDWLRYNDVAFGATGASGFTATIALPKGQAGKKIEIRLDTATGTLIGTLTTVSTGGWTIYKDQSINIITTTGTHHVFLVGRGGNGIANLHGFKFAPASTKFTLNDRVVVSSGPLNVRSLPSTSGTILGTQVTGALGTVVGGPTAANGYNWWNINFDNGIDGWVAENFLAKYVPPPPPAPTATLTANPTSVTSGQSSTLTWSSTNTTSCTGSGFSTGGTVFGSISVLPTQTTTYALSCAGGGGIANSSTTVVVSSVSPSPTPPPPPPPVPTATLAANPISITSGQSSTLIWSSTDATSCVGTGFSTGGVVSGLVTVAPAISTTYLLSCMGSGGTANSSITVTVSAVSPPPPPPPPVSTKFSINDRVVVSSGPVNVRSTPSISGTILGTQATGALGTVVGGPTAADGYNWWNVNFDGGVNGWTIEDFLRKPTTTIFMLVTPNLSAQSGGSLTVTTKWEGKPMNESFNEFIQVINPNNQIIAKLDVTPSPTTAVWSGPQITTYSVPIPTTVGVGTYPIRIGLSQLHSPYARIPLTMGPGVSVDDQLRYNVGTVTVSAVAPPPPPPPPPPSNNAFKTGMHAHRLYNGGGDPEPLFHYGMIRDWDIENTQDPVIWKSDGSINFTLVDQVYAGHAKNGAKVLKVFAMTPTWESKYPSQANPQYPNWTGAESGPRDLNEYEDYVYRFVTHERSSLWAVEGWNEPFGCTESHKEFTTMSARELADVQKRLYLATKRVDPSIPVFSPAQSYICGIPVILSATTTQGEPMWKYFDVLTWHGYNEAANGAAGSDDYASIVSTIRSYMAAAGVPSTMPIADTEHGWGSWAPSGATFAALTNDQKGKILYDTATLAKSLGVLTIGWYSYDDSLIGQPMNNSTLSTWLQKSYTDLNTP